MPRKTPNDGKAQQGLFRHIRDEFERRSAGLLWTIFGALLIVALGTLTDVFQQLLGITDLQNELRDVQEELAATEDTIYSYKYDHTLPEVAQFRRILAAVGIGAASAGELVANDYNTFNKTLEDRTQLDEIDKSFLRDVRRRLRERVTRTFYFAAAQNTESTLAYEIKCFTKDVDVVGKPFTFSVTVNGKNVLPTSERQSKVDLSDYWRNLTPVASRSKHHFYRQGLNLSLFGEPERCTTDSD